VEKELADPGDRTGSTSPELRLNRRSLRAARCARSREIVTPRFRREDLPCRRGHGIALHEGGLKPFNGFMVEYRLSCRYFDANARLSAVGPGENQAAQAV
jgi:hypothetical protein